MIWERVIQTGHKCGKALQVKFFSSKNSAENIYKKPLSVKNPFLSQEFYLIFTSSDLCSAQAQVHY